MKLQYKKNHIYISTYHFIRKKIDKFYKNINYLDLNNFKNQIFYFEKKFNIIGFDDAINVLNSKRKYHKPFVILTFDDGYLDHYEYVFPFLLKRKLTGLFYPFANSIKKGFITDTNKIHFILAKSRNISQIETDMLNYLKNKTNYNLANLEKIKKINYKYRKLQWLNKKLKPTEIHNNHKISYIKRILQFYLPNKIRYKINDYLFRKYVTTDKLEFAENLYLQKKHMKEMKKDNMHFGSHGTSHNYLGFMGKKEQDFEIKNSLKFLENLFPKENNFSMCYPYGSYNKETIEIVKKYNFKLGLSIRHGSVDLLKKNNQFILPRYDTNDFI